MQIHLSKPGGRREGPFTVEQINDDLAAQKYQETDYWAWYEGLAEWVPLHSVPGVISLRSKTHSSGPCLSTAAPRQVPAPETEPAPAPQEQAELSTEPQASPPSLQKQLSSGMPFAALEQIVIFTTGEAQAGSRSPATAGLLQAVVGEPLDQIRQKVPRDVVTHCDFLQSLRGGGALPEAAWRAMAKLKPQLVQQARGGNHRICIRTYPIENGDVLAAVLFYNKQKL
jgi:hypothetical protein